MMSKVYSAFQTSMKPASALLAINVDAIEKIATKQATLISGLMKKSVKLTEQMAEDESFKAVLGSGKASVGEAAQDVKATFIGIKDILVETTGKNGEVVKGVYYEAKQTVTDKAADAKAEVSAFKDSVSQKAKAASDKVKSLLPGKPALEAEAVVEKKAAPKKIRSVKAAAE
jgi:hypothetical protein